MRSLCYLLVFLGCLLCPQGTEGQESPLFQSQQNLKLSLVTIKAFNMNFSGVDSNILRAFGQEHRGNGIIVDSSGIIVTNNHVIAGARHILVTMSDGKTVEARVLYNGTLDFCFLKIPQPLPLRAIARANFSETKPGDRVIALPYDQGVIEGSIVRLINGAASETEFLELDLNLHPGDSGGPVLSAQGSLLGLIMGQKKSDTHKSYAISSQRIWKEYRQFNGSVLVGAE